MQCFILSRDLMFSSQASGAASAVGLSVSTVSAVGQIESSELSIVVLDLTTPGIDILATVESLKVAGARVVSVGPHVHEAKLTAATEAGCDAVLTKGQASRELGDVLRSLIESG